MSNTKTEAIAIEIPGQNLVRVITILSCGSEPPLTQDEKVMLHMHAELLRLDAIEQRYNEMMANPCPEWDNKAYMQAIANLRAQLAKAVEDEREACAKVCETTEWTSSIDEWRDMTKKDVADKSMHACAAAIRARSNT